MDNWITDWIIAIANSACSGIIINRFRGTKKEVAGKLCELVIEDMKKDLDNWDYGTELSEDVIDECCGHEFSAYGIYQEYSINYTAKEFSHVDVI